MTGYPRDEFVICKGCAEWLLDGDETTMAMHGLDEQQMACNAECMRDPKYVRSLPYDGLFECDLCWGVMYTSKVVIEAENRF